MGREIDSNPLVGTIKNVDISHQEMDRIFNALEDLYEDMGEFEDAMKSEFKDFLASFPIIELKEDERVAGGLVFKVKPDPPEDQWEATKYTAHVRDGKDLWRVCHKSKWARLCVPKLEFEVQADGRRHIDSLYNHIGSAITNLAAHCSVTRSAMDEGTRQKILETVEGLTQLLDVMEPWTVEVYDPSGVSEFLPATDVSIERYDPSAE